MEGNILRSIELDGRSAKPGGQAFVISGLIPESQSASENPKAAVTQETSFTGSGNRINHRFPKHSITWLEFEI